MNDGSLRVIPTNPQEVLQAESDISVPRQDYNEGIDYIKNKELAMAANSFHNALKGWEQEGNQHGIANASDQLGDILAQRGDHEKAIGHWKRAYQICTDDFDRYSLLTLEKKMANSYLGMKDYDNALELYWEIFDEYSGNRDPAGVTTTLEIMSEIFIATDQKDKAVDCYALIAKTHANYKHAKEAKEWQTKTDELQKS